MQQLQPRALEPLTVVETTVIPLHLILTMALNPPLASQDGPRREEVAGQDREHHQTTR